MRKIVLLTAVSAMFVAMLPGTPAQALNDRSWVSSAGTGTACTRALPCSGFQVAHDATNDGGEINCVDAADYGAVQIIKNLVIDCSGTFGGVSISSVVVNGAGIRAELRNLSFQGLGVGSTAITFLNGTGLYVEGCQIHGYTSGAGRGISFTPPDGVTGFLHVVDTLINANGLASSGGGIAIQPAGSGSARVVIERSRIDGNTYGIFAVGTGSTGVIIVHVRDSVVTVNKFDGIGGYTSAGHSTVSMTVDHTSSLLNGGNGILAQGPSAFVFLANSTVMSNVTGLNASGGTIVSYQNNQLTGNVTDGAPTATISVK
jgi:hypothetical protein